MGEFGDSFAFRDPTMLEVLLYYPDRRATPELIRAVDEEVAKVAEGVDADELERVTSSLVASLLWEFDQIIERTTHLAVLEQIHGRAELVNEIPSLLRSVTTSQVSGAAALWLDARSRAVLEWIPGKKA